MAASQPYSTGPVDIYVGMAPAAVQAAAVALAAGNAPFGAVQAAQTLLSFQQLLALTPIYLGTGEVAPRIKFRRHFTPVHNDTTGPVVPFDRIWSGREGMVAVTLTCWRDPVMRAIRQLPLAGTLPGFEGATTRGTLMVTEGCAYPLYLRFPFFDSHPAMKNAGMVPGYRFFAATLDGDEDIEPGTGPNKNHLIWYCHNVMDSKTRALGLYDYNVGNCPAIPPAT